MNVLAGDIGATHARLALVRIEAGGRRILAEARYESRRFDGVEPILREFVQGLPEAPDRACLGIPGPVVEGVARLPILGWEVRRDSLAEAADVPDLRIMNDFEALAHSLPLLGEEDLSTLQEGAPPAPGTEPGTLALVGAGTGLGHAYLTWDGARYRVRPAEGGHADFAPRSELEWALRQHLAERHGRVSCERVVSGPGLVDTYRFLVETGRAAGSPETAAALEREDPGEVVSSRGMAGTDEAAVRALDLFVSAYGAQVGNVALILRAEGGVFLGGGVAPQVLDKLREGPFLEAFVDKGRLSHLLERIPVRVILNRDAGVLGAAAVAAEPAGS